MRTTALVEVSVEGSQERSILFSKSIIALLVAFDELVEQAGEGVNVSEMPIFDDVQVGIRCDGSLLSNTGIMS